MILLINGTAQQWRAPSRNAGSPPMVASCRTGCCLSLFDFVFFPFWRPGLLAYVGILQQFADMKEDMTDVQKSLLEKCDINKMLETVELKYDEIVDHLQEAIQVCTAMAAHVQRSLL